MPEARYIGIKMFQSTNMYWHGFKVQAGVQSISLAGRGFVINCYDRIIELSKGHPIISHVARRWGCQNRQLNMKWTGRFVGVYFKGTVQVILKACSYFGAPFDASNEATGMHRNEKSLEMQTGIMSPHCLCNSSSRWYLPRFGFIMAHFCTNLALTFLKAHFGI